MTAQLLVFYLLAGLTVGSASLVVTRRNPVHSALFLVLAFMGVAGIYVILEAEFLAAVQVLVYAGGIMVLFLFVIMLVDLEERGRPAGAKVPRFRAKAFGASLLLCGLLVTLLLAAFLTTPYPASSGNGEALRSSGGNLESIAIGMYQHYVLPFELASVLLLVAMIGAVVLAKSRL